MSSNNPFDGDDEEPVEVEEDQADAQEEQVAELQAQVEPEAPRPSLWAKIKAAASNSIMGKTLASIREDVGNAGGPYWLIKTPFRIVTSAVKLAVGVVGQVAKTFVLEPIRALVKAAVGFAKGVKAFFNATFVEGFKQTWNGKGFKEKFKGVGRIFAGLVGLGALGAATFFTAGAAPAILGSLVAAGHAVAGVATVGYAASTALVSAGYAAASVGASTAIATATALVSTGVVASSGLAASATIAGIGVSGTAATGVGIGMLAIGAAVGAAAVIGVSKVTYKAYDAVKQKVSSKGAEFEKNKGKISESNADFTNQSNTNNSGLANRLESVEINSAKQKQHLATDPQSLKNVATNSGGSSRTLVATSAVRLAPEDVVKVNILLKNKEPGCHLKYDGNERGVMRITGRDPVSAVQVITQEMPDVAKQIKGTGFILKMPTDAPDTQIKILLDKVKNGIPKITGVINGKGETIPVIMDKGKAILKSPTVTPQKSTNDRSPRLT